MGKFQTPAFFFQRTEKKCYFSRPPNQRLGRTHEASKKALTGQQLSRRLPCEFHNCPSEGLFKEVICTARWRRDLTCQPKNAHFRPPNTSGERVSCDRQEQATTKNEEQGAPEIA
jgi:hypothetical protein